MPLKSDKIEKLEKRLEQQEKRLQQKKAYLKAQKKKADISRKIDLGALVIKAGLDHLDDESLFGGLLFLQERLREEGNTSAWKKRALHFKSEDA